LAPRCVVLIGAAADPLSIRAVLSHSTCWVESPPHKARSRDEMAALLIILVVTIGLAVRAGVYGRGRIWSPADAESLSLMDACARTFVLVLLSLLGLFALGVMYGNVLGSANASP
jgi:hypothetical protein